MTKSIDEKGLWANIHAKRKRGEKPNPPGHPDRPSAQDFKDAQKTSKKEQTEAKCKTVKELRSRKKSEVTTDSKIKQNNSNDTETTMSEASKSAGVGWMLKADPKLGAAVKAKRDINKKREASYGKPSAGISVPRTPKNEYDRKVDSYLNKKYNKEEVEHVEEAKTPSDSDLHKTLGSTKNMQQGVEALKKKHGMSDEQAKKHIRRLMGMKEEVEQIDELSKATLGSYVKKASRTATVDRKIAGDFENQANKSRTPSMKAASQSLADKWKSKAWKRLNNIDKAIDRLTKEEVEQVDELSQNTLRNYHGKSALDIRKKRDQLNKGTLSTADHKKAQRRVTGINRAANKMEEVEEGMKPDRKAPGWMLRADPKLKAKIDANKAKNKEFKKLVGTKKEQASMCEQCGKVHEGNCSS